MTYEIAVALKVCAGLAAVGIVALVLFAGVFALTGSKWYAPRAGVHGQYVAEVWLEWSICRGSTMYRQRFASRTHAYLMMRLHAFLLDLHLPRYFWDIDWEGKALQVEHGYSLCFALRELTDEEAQSGVAPVWSSVLPGYTNYRGVPPGF